MNKKDIEIGSLKGEVKFLLRQRAIIERQIEEKKTYHFELDNRINDIMSQLEKVSPESFTTFPPKKKKSCVNDALGETEKKQ